MFLRSVQIRIGLVITTLVLLGGFLSTPARATTSGPSFIYPVDEQTLDYQGSYLFKVTELAQAQGYLWGFFQNGVMVWENLRDEGQLSSTEYGIHPDTEAHSRFAPGQVEVWVRGLINGEWTDATVITITLRSAQVPILALAYFPRDASDPDLLDAVETGWTGENFTVAQMQQATQDMIDAALPLISDATRYHGYQNPNAPPYLEYYLLEKQEFFTKMPRGHGFEDGAYRPNYGQIMRDIDICTYVDTYGVKEVWIYGYHSHLPTPDGTFIVPDESKMSSRYGDVSNALPRDEEVLETYRLPICTNSYVMYNFTYQPGGAEAIGNSIHNRLHQIENVIFYAENRGYPPTDTNIFGSTFWDDFSVYGARATLPGYQASCGNTHAPPNTTDGYDYTSTNTVQSNCATWHPDDAQTTYVPVDCSTWDCTELGFYTWFMQSMPGLNNGITYNGMRMRNWWEAQYDFNHFIDVRHSLYLPLPATGVANNSFENGLDGWSVVALTGGVGLSTTGYDDAEAVSFSGQAIMDQVITGLVPDTEYTLSAWVQTNAGPDHPVWLWISEYGGETLFQGAVDTQGWQQLTHVFRTGPTNTRVRIRFHTPTNGGAALVDAVELTGPLAPPPPDPPPGTLPGLLEAENAPTFFDTDAINEGGAHRSDGLDVETCEVCLRTGSNGYSVGWTAPGEWLEFPVTFAESGDYRVRVRVTTPEAAQALRVRLNGTDVTGVLALPQTGGWGNWQNATSVPFSATAGAATIRAELLSDMFNLDMIEIVPVE